MIPHIVTYILVDAIMFPHNRCDHTITFISIVFTLEKKKGGTVFVSVMDHFQAATL